VVYGNLFQYPIPNRLSSYKFQDNWVSASDDAQVLLVYVADIWNPCGL